MNGGTMFDTTKMEESSGKGIDDNATGDLGDIADARTKDEEGNPIGGETATEQPPTEQIETARLAKEEADKNKTPDQIEEERIAAEEAKANEGKTPDQIAAEKKTSDEKAAAENIEKIKNEARAEFLKSFGVKTETELKEKLNPTVADTPDQAKAKEEQYTANLLNFATKENMFTASEFATLQNLKHTSDNDLAFNYFSEQYKEINKDRHIEGVASPVTEDEIKEAFNQQYHITSEDPGLKSIGEKQIKSAADAKRSDLEAKYNEAKATYDDYAYRDKNSAPFINFVNKTITDSIPTQLKVTGKDGVEINIPISNVDIKEIEKALVNDKTFEDFLANGETAIAKEAISRTVEVYLWSKNKETILNTVRDVSYDAGLKVGKVGATAPFDSNKKPTAIVSGTENELSKSEKEKLKASFGSPLGRQ